MKKFYYVALTRDYPIGTEHSGPFDSHEDANAHIDAHINMDEDTRDYYRGEGITMTCFIIEIDSSTGHMNTYEVFIWDSCNDWGFDDEDGEE